jgi:hypothetical protein
MLLSTAYNAATVQQFPIFQRDASVWGFGLGTACQSPGKRKISALSPAHPEGPSGHLNIPARCTVAYRISLQSYDCVRGPTGGLLYSRTDTSTTTAQWRRVPAGKRVEQALAAHPAAQVRAAIRDLGDAWHYSPCCPCPAVAAVVGLHFYFMLLS